MDVREAYTRWSESYDTDPNRTRDLDAEVTRRVLAELPRRPDSIVEIGCGTGKNTAFLAGFAARSVLALDFSEGMIARARAKVTADNVTFAVADITQPWPCAGASADLVVCNLVLEHVRDLGPVFAEAARVLGPGGRLFVCELHPFRQYQGTRANFRRGDETTEIPAFVHHLTDFTGAARDRGLSLLRLDEWWHEEDEAGGPPRLASFVFGKED